MAFPKKTVEEEELIEFRSTKPRLSYQVKPKGHGENPEPAIVVDFINGIYRTSDPFILKKMRSAILRQPIASEQHGLKGLVSEVEPGDRPNLALVEGKE
jgi:hypothetical protein